MKVILKIGKDIVEQIENSALGLGSQASAGVRWIAQHKTENGFLDRRTE